MKASLTSIIYPAMYDSGCPDTWNCTSNGIELTPVSFAEMLRWAAENAEAAKALASALKHAIDTVPF
jgi:hypothetical protein